MSVLVVVLVSPRLPSVVVSWTVLVVVSVSDSTKVPLSLLPTSMTVLVSVVVIVLEEVRLPSVVLS